MKTDMINRKRNTPMGCVPFLISTVLFNSSGILVAEQCDPRSYFSQDSEAFLSAVAMWSEENDAAEDDAVSLSLVSLP